MKKDLLTYFLLFIVSIAFGQQDHWTKKLLPDHHKIQYAGEIGLFSASYGHSFFEKENLELDLYLGFLPKSVGGDDITTIALKTSFFPLKLNPRGTSLLIEPIGFGVNLYHSFGENLNKYRDTDKYPENYYWWTIRTRIAPFITGRFGHAIKEGNFKSLHLYYELGTNDLYFFSWYENRESFPLHKIINFSLGICLKYRK